MEDTLNPISTIHSLAIHNMQQAFRECSQFYEVIRTHQGFRLISSDLREQLRQSEQEVHFTTERLMTYLQSGQMTPEMAEEAYAYAQCHLEMVMDLLSGLNAFSRVPLN